MRALFVAVAAIAGAGAVGVAAFPDGPPVARTGGFGEASCSTCHVGITLNVEGPGLILDSLPKRYEPGVTYRLSVRLSRASMRRAGFQIAARFAQGRNAGKQAGHFVSLDSLTRITVFEPKEIEYLSHTKPGTSLTHPETARWFFKWTAPTEGGPVMFNLAANAANGDGSPAGDAIYLREYRLSRR
jgi:hypothetical protein